MSKPTRIIIPKTGISTGESGPRAIYDPLSSQVMGQLGSNVETMRASHVEPGSGLSHAALSCLRNAGCVNVGSYDESLKDYKLTIDPNYASHWFADMTPTGHDVVLGPFPPDGRDAALAREVEWLREHNIPVCGPCRESDSSQETDAS